MKTVIRIGLILALMLAVFYGMLRYLPLFPIKIVQVDGDYWHISTQEIIQSVPPELFKGYFNTDITQIQKNLIDNIPWVKTASVARVWPNRIIIDIFQKKPVALWNSNALLDEQGGLFYPLSPTFPDDLPVFVGNTSEEKLVMKQYQHMLEALKDQSFYIDCIRVSDGDRNWEITLSNQVVVMLGNHDILTTLKRFIRIYQQLLSEKEQVPAYVDMRYSHGVAVKWALSEEKEDGVKAKK